MHKLDLVRKRARKFLDRIPSLKSGSFWSVFVYPDLGEEVVSCVKIYSLDCPPRISIGTQRTYQRGVVSFIRVKSVGLLIFWIKLGLYGFSLRPPPICVANVAVVTLDPCGKPAVRFSQIYTNITTQRHSPRNF